MRKIACLAAILGAAFVAGSVIAQGQPDFSKVEIKTTDLGHGLYMLEGQGGDIAVAAKPLAGLEVTRKSDDANRDQFTRLVYRSIKARS